MPAFDPACYVACLPPVPPVCSRRGPWPWTWVRYQDILCRSPVLECYQLVLYLLYFLLRFTTLLQARSMGLDLGVDVITQLPLSDKVDRDWFKKQVRMGHYTRYARGLVGVRACFSELGDGGQGQGRPLCSCGMRWTAARPAAAALAPILYLVRSRTCGTLCTCSHARTSLVPAAPAPATVHGIGTSRAAEMPDLQQERASYTHTAFLSV